MGACQQHLYAWKMNVLYHFIKFYFVVYLLFEIINFKILIVCGMDNGGDKFGLFGLTDSISVPFFFPQRCHPACPLHSIQIDALDVNINPSWDICSHRSL